MRKDDQRGLVTQPSHRALRRFCLIAIAASVLGALSPTNSWGATDPNSQHWVGTWAASPQRGMSGQTETFHNQTLRLIVHTSIGGKQARIKISNVFGAQPLVIGSAHIARRAADANIDPSSDRALTFGKQSSITIPAGSLAVSDPVDLVIPALSDVAISLFFPNETAATTVHLLAKQTNYISAEAGDSTATANFRGAKTLSSWPFITGVDVAAAPGAAAIVAFGSSLTDGDGSTKDTNRRWPDVLAERLHKNGNTQLGVLNEGVIGNRLLSDSQSPRQSGGPPPLGPVFQVLGPSLGEAGVTRFERDVLSQAGVKYAILGLGVNDILFPGSFIPATENVTAQQLIAGNRELTTRAHKKGIRVIGTTIPPFEHALFRDPLFQDFYSAEKEKVRQEVNAWIRSGGEFDGVIDFDAAAHDPNHPTQLLPAFDSGDHLHVNNAGNVAQGNAISLALFQGR